MKISVDAIKLGERCRREAGWLDDLERSIAEHGVLQPVGVTPDYVLVFGARRLQAAKNIGLSEIPCRVIDVDADDPAAALKIERDENECRKDFTPSEKIAIAERIEEALGNRRGQRTDLQLPDRGPEVKGRETRDIAADAVGWSGRQYDRAKAVFREAPPAVVAMVDAGEVSIKAAYDKHVRGNKPEPPKKKFSITVWRDTTRDASEVIHTLGEQYAVELALAILQRSGHATEVREIV